MVAPEVDVVAEEVKDAATKANASELVVEGDRELRELLCSIDLAMRGGEDDRVQSVAVTRRLAAPML